jgi:hypothetical protein
MSFNSGVLTFLLVHISGAGHPSNHSVVELESVGSDQRNSLVSDAVGELSKQVHLTFEVGLILGEGQ